ncbi:MAG: thermonuclease family protein [Alphaproteobacteria bacterium]|nr:thermonuclease family protein [Alphaproteobacteria bacterium]
MKILLAVLLFFAFDADAKVKVIDGDSILIGKKDIRLLGIDAPEYDQTCFDENGYEYDCGQESYLFLRLLVEKGLNNQEKVKCNKKGVDKYKRDLSECFIGKTNINLAMIKSGYAVTYRHDSYEKEEYEAKTHKKGIWQGKFMRPELYRILKKHQKESKKLAE